jgi:hypothetical protein
MKEDEPRELKNANGQKKVLVVPVDDKKDAAQLREFYVETNNDNLFGSNELDPHVRELTLVDDD